MKGLVEAKESKAKRFKIGLLWKIIPAVVIVVGLFISLILAYILPDVENALYEEKKIATKNEVLSAWTILQHYYDMEKTGALTKDQAQEQAKAAIGALRYGPEMTDYFFVIDFRPYMIVHPMKKELVNTDIATYKDAQGTYMFQNMMQIAKDQKEGFTSYQWQYKNDTTRIVPKLSYVKEFEPWGWIVGSGIYTVDVQEATQAMQT